MSFLDLGIEKGDHVALHLHSSPEFLMCLFGLAKIGAVAVPINEQYLADEAEYILENSDAICVVVEPLFYETYQELLARGHYFPKGVVVARAGTESPKSNIDFSSIYTPLGNGRRRSAGIYDFWMMRCEQSAILRDSCELASTIPCRSSTPQAPPPARKAWCSRTRTWCFRGCTEIGKSRCAAAIVC